MELCLISSISCLFLRIGHAGRRHQVAVQHGGNDLAPNNNEAVDVGMEDDPDKNPAKVCWKERLILLLVRDRERTGERAILFNIKTFIFLFGFLLSFPRAKLYVLSRCEPVLISVKKADYSSSIRIWSKCSYTGRPQGKSLDRSSPVPCAVWPNRWRIGFWRPWTAVQRISSSLSRFEK